jgi:hypothetical protein
MLILVNVITMISYKYFWRINLYALFSILDLFRNIELFKNIFK